MRRACGSAKVHGLTAAASVSLTAAFARACGVGAWRIVVVGVPVAFLVLLFGRRLDKLSEHVFGGEPDDHAE